jgi:hypothetical protein
MPSVGSRPSGMRPAEPPLGDIADVGDEIVLHLSLDDSADELEKARAVADVVEYAVRVTRAVQSAQEMKTWAWRPILLASAAAFTLLFTAYMFLAERDWIFGPSVAAISPARREAGLRYAMFLATARINDYRSSRGTVPATLGDVGEDWPGVAYRTQDGATFDLRATNPNGAPLVLQSSDDPRAFLGLSRVYLRERP